MRTRLAASALALALLSVPATAHHVALSDPNDARGPLDVKAVRVDGTPPEWTIRTWAWWQTNDIRDRGYFLVYFDTFGSPRFDYYVLAGSTGSSMYANLYRDFAEQGDVIVDYSLRVSRRDGRSVTIQIPLAKMRHPERRLHYVWKVKTLLTGNACRNVCLDGAPEGGGITEPHPRDL